LVARCSARAVGCSKKSDRLVVKMLNVPGITNDP
jgi:hypothetical protein